MRHVSCGIRPAPVGLLRSACSGRRAPVGVLRSACIGALQAAELSAETDVLRAEMLRQVGTRRGAVHPTHERVASAGCAWRARGERVMGALGRRSGQTSCRRSCGRCSRRTSRQVPPAMGLPATAALICNGCSYRSSLAATAALICNGCPYL